MIYQNWGPAVVDPKKKIIVFIMVAVCLLCHSRGRSITSQSWICVKLCGNTADKSWEKSVDTLHNICWIIRLKVCITFCSLISFVPNEVIWNKLLYLRVLVRKCLLNSEWIFVTRLFIGCGGSWVLGRLTFPKAQYKPLGSSAQFLAEYLEQILFMAPIWTEDCWA